jgi:hypothetical protein
LLALTTLLTSLDLPLAVFLLRSVGQRHTGKQSLELEQLPKLDVEML